MKDTFIDIVKQYVLDNPDLNYSDIASKILSDGVINRSHRTVRLYVGEVSQMIDNGTLDATQMSYPDVDGDDSDITEVEFEDDEKVVEDDTELSAEQLELFESDTPANVTLNEPTTPADTLLYSGDNYSIISQGNGETFYAFEYSKIRYYIPVEVVDKVFLSHSRSGLNLTEQQVLNLLEIEEMWFRVIKARLSLGKESPTVGPYTEDTYAPEEIYDMLSAYSGELLESLSEIDDPVRSTLIRETKKQLILAQNRNVLFESFIKDLKNHVGDIQIRNLQGSADGSVGTEITVVISDMHFGVESELYNLKVAESKLKEIQTHVNAFAHVNPDTRVNIVLPGDILHNISGVMHPNSWKSTEAGMWGANALIKPYELLISFLVGITNLKALYVVGGNHDRLNADKRLENTAEGAKLLTYMLTTTLPKSIIVEFDSRHITFDSGNLRYIIQHGDLGADKKKKVEEVVWDHGDPNKFNIVLTGHHHTRIIARGDDVHKARRMSVPAFCPTDDYAKDCGYDNNPGFLIIQEKDGRPVVIDIPLVY